MKILMEATSTLMTIDEVPVRVWKGQTEGGQEVLVFVHRIAVGKDQDTAALHTELQECMSPSSVTPPLGDLFYLSGFKITLIKHLL